MQVQAMLALERLLAPGRIAQRRASLREERPVVIMGRGKSGTRLISFACLHLGLAMGASPELATGDILHKGFRDTIKVLARRHFATDDAAHVPEADLARFEHEAAAALRFVRGQPGGERGWGWKWPETYLIAPIVQHTFPQARYIHMVRDGRDIAFNTHLTDDEHRDLGRSLLTHIGMLGKPRHLQAAASWQYQVRRYRAFAAALPPGHTFEFSYEALCQDPADVMQRVADFLEIPFSAESRDYARATFTRQHVARYLQCDPNLVAQVEDLIGPTLTDLGYGLSQPVDAAPHA